MFFIANSVRMFYIKNNSELFYLSNSRGTHAPAERAWTQAIEKDGGQGRNRTNDTRIFSPLLYQLSYLAIGGGAY